MDYQSGYAHYLTEEKRASANTLSSYLRDVTQYLHWLEGEGVPPEQAAQKDVESYTRFLSAKGKSAATVTRSLASLKSFYSYLIAEGRVSVNPARGLAPRRWNSFWSSRMPRMPRAAAIGPCWSCFMPRVSVSLN